MLISKNLLKYLPWITFFLVLTLLVLHLFGTSVVTIDNTTILLIILLLLSPLSNSLKKIKWGDFEAEIEPSEVKKIESEVKKLPEDNSQEPYEINYIIENIQSVLDQDHILALAKLRIELEKVLLKILTVTENTQGHQLGLSNILRKLEKSASFDKQFISPIRDVVAIGNRAIHGEEVKKETAKKIIDIGVDLLRKLYRELYDFISKPINSEVISEKDRDEYFFSSYHVTTIVPLSKEPYMNRYIFNQEQLDQFLENYDEFAEFIVEIKKIKK
jgi:hypothetical protein